MTTPPDGSYRVAFEVAGTGDLVAVYHGTDDNTYRVVVNDASEAPQFWARRRVVSLQLDGKELARSITNAAEGGGPLRLRGDR